MLSAGRVIAVKSRLREMADRKMDLILAADSDHRVWVELGIKELPFTGQSDALTVPPADVSDVSTPPTPPPDWDARSSRNASALPGGSMISGTARGRSSGPRPAS